jgi:hypothetical protein
MLSTFTELFQDVLDRAGENLADTSGDFYVAAQRATVRGYRELCNRHPFLFLRAPQPAAFVTVAPYAAGLVTLTGGSATATFSIAPAVGLGSFAGRKFYPLSSSQGFYRILTHTAGSASFDLDVAWQGTDGAVPFTVYKDEYTLTTPYSGGTLRHLLGIYSAQDGREIELISEEKLREDWPEPRTGADEPLRAARIGMTGIRLSHYPTVARRYEVPHTLYPPDLDGVGVTILVPTPYRQLIADAGLYFLHAMRNDNRADGAGVLFGKGVEILIVEDGRLKQALNGPRYPTTGPYR